MDDVTPSGTPDWRTVVAELADEEDDLEVVCDNGCPEGAQGRHKFSCPLARPGDAP